MNKDNIHAPLVSILCITYNHVDYIKEALESFLMQKTTFTYEIVVHDDASNDGTTDILKQYKSLYPDIFKVIFQSENQYSKKVDIVKEYLYPCIHGKYIAICEGDDYWTNPLKLQKQVEFLENNPSFGLVYTDINRVNEQGDVIDEHFFKHDPFSFCKTFEDYLIYAPFRAPCTWLFRKELYNIKEAKYIVGDLPQLLDVVAVSKIYRLNEVMAHYRVLTNSASHFTEIVRYYDFMKGIFKIQMDYAIKYGVSKKIIYKIKTRFALESYNFAVVENDKQQIELANRLLKDHPKVSYKFKVVKFLSQHRFGRALMRRRLMKRVGYIR